MNKRELLKNVQMARECVETASVNGESPHTLNAILWLADAVEMLAETKTNEPDPAYAEINHIRQRAGLPPID